MLADPRGPSKNPRAALFHRRDMPEAPRQRPGITQDCLRPSVRGFAEFYGFYIDLFVSSLLTSDQAGHQRKFMNTGHSHTFGKHRKRGLQLSFLSTLIAQSLVCAVAQASSGELPPNVDVSTAVGLVAGYTFDEGSGTTVPDVSVYGNAGTISGAAWTSPGKFSNALNFDGTNWVTVNDSDSLDLSRMTLEAWAYPTAATGTWTTILLKEAPPGYNLAYHLQGDPSNHPSSYITTDVAGLQGIVGPNPLPLNTWTYVAATYNGAMFSLYVNGIVVASQPVSGNILPSVGPLRFGGNSIWGEYFVGKIDEVRIYNRALNQTEIQADMNAPVGNCVLTPGYWTNHAWYVQTIQIGCVTYTRSQGIAILRSNSSRDKTYSLAQQLIGAKLNIACRNTNSSCMASAIAAADSWLCAHPVGSGVTASSPAWLQVKPSYDLLVSYNAGQLCAPSCGM
jgi:Concanavalin A-like lectin/glucanases superfamily